MRALKTLLLSLFLVPTMAWGQFFQFQDETCSSDIYVQAPEFEEDGVQRMFKTVQTEAKKKDNKLTFKNEQRQKKTFSQLNDKKVLPEQLYFHVTLSRKGYLFQQCTAHVQLKRAKNYRVSKKDEPLYQGTSTRQFPRITLQGNERCVRAIQDAFVHIPSCQTTATE